MHRLSVSVARTIHASRYIPSLERVIIPFFALCQLLHSSHAKFHLDLDKWNLRCLMEGKECNGSRIYDFPNPIVLSGEGFDYPVMRRMAALVSSADASDLFVMELLIWFCALCESVVLVSRHASETKGVKLTLVSSTRGGAGVDVRLTSVEEDILFSKTGISIVLHNVFYQLPVRRKRVDSHKTSMCRRIIIFI